MIKRTLCNQTIQILIIGAFDAQVPPANVVDGLIVDHEAAVGVLKGSVGGEDRVVGLDDRGGDLRGRVDAELKLALLAIVHGETLHKKCTESGPGSTAEGMEDEETLKTGAVVCDTTNLVQDLINELLAHGVMTTCVVVRGILFASDHVLGMEKLTVGTSADLVDDIGFQVAVDGSRNIFALT